MAHEGYHGAIRVYWSKRSTLVERTSFVLLPLVKGFKVALEKLAWFYVLFADFLVPFFLYSCRIFNDLKNVGCILIFLHFILLLLFLFSRSFLRFLVQDCKILLCILYFCVNLTLLVLLELPEELLSMGSAMWSVTRFDILLNFVPVFAEHEESLQKLLVFLFGPSTPLVLAFDLGIILVIISLICLISFNHISLLLDQKIPKLVCIGKIVS